MADDKSAGGSGPDTPGVVTLAIPCAPEYVGTARLTMLGVASRMGFSYDQVEDIRLAVGEACTNAIERAGRRGGEANPNMITIRSHVDSGRLTIEVEDQAEGEAISPDLDASATDIDGMNSQELGAILMEILVDEVTVESRHGGGTMVRLTKYTSEG